MSPSKRAFWEACFLFLVLFSVAIVFSPLKDATGHFLFNLFPNSQAKILIPTEAGFKIPGPYLKDGDHLLRFDF